jgi:hypothetical protein
MRADAGQAAETTGQQPANNRPTTGQQQGAQIGQ